MARAELTYPSGKYPTADKRDLLVFCGPTISVHIGLDRNYDPDRPGVVPKLAISNAWALIDTGATLSYIDSALAKKLALPEIDKEIVTPVLGGEQEITTYMAHIHVPSLAFTLIGSFGGVDLGPDHVAAILGREFLMNWKLTYDGRTGIVALED